MNYIGQSGQSSSPCLQFWPQSFVSSGVPSSCPHLDSLRWGLVPACDHGEIVTTLIWPTLQAYLYFYSRKYRHMGHILGYLDPLGWGFVYPASHTRSHGQALHRYFERQFGQGPSLRKYTKHAEVGPPEGRRPPPKSVALLRALCLWPPFGGAWGVVEGGCWYRQGA